MNHMNITHLNNKQNLNELKKLEAMREVIHKNNSKESSNFWRKHVPVYGWTQMNYPSGLRPSLTEKYKQKQNNNEEENYNNNNSILMNLRSKSKIVSQDKSPFNEKQDVIEDDDDEENTKSKYRLDPEKVNEYVMKESKKIL
jgi:hypothetical protein